jgi:hypothetical protein
MRARLPVIVGIAAVIALSASGCADIDAEADAGTSPTTTASETATPTPTPTPTPTMDSRGASYATLEEMRVALEGAGIECPSLVNLGEVPAAKESGFCDDYMWGLSVYADIDARNEVLQLNVDSSEPTMFLVGPNWLLASADAQADMKALLAGLQPDLGGVVWNASEPFPS